MNSPLHKSLTLPSLWILWVVLATANLPASRAAEPAPPGQPPPLLVDLKNPLLLEEPTLEESPQYQASRDLNATCFVCHINFKNDPLVLGHALDDIGCASCHGPSPEHVADEANLTPPDRLFARDKIDAACTECHSTHNASARDILARWQDRCPDRTDPAQIVCTDCHGEHRLHLRSIVWDKNTRRLLSKPGQEIAETGLFARTNLVAWCIVPFDAKRRGPEERAAMLEKLGIKYLAYDYRAEHIPTFDAEMDALKRHGITLLAWWFPGALNDEARLILQVLKRHDLQTQLWITGGGATPQNQAEQQALVEAEARRIQPIAEAAAAQGCTVALYNHGGWFGEPENQIAIIHRLQAQGLSNVGIVYNLHHGHEHLDRFAELMKSMKPYLMALNLNGMTKRGDQLGKKILPLAQGDLDLDLLRIIRDSGWQGPVGILNHTDEDAEGRLQDNLDGLRWLVRQLDGRVAGPQPVPHTWRDPGAPPGPAQSSPKGQPSLAPAFGKAIQGGMVLEGHANFRSRPLTIECWAKLNSRQGFNILVASDPKASAEHWELYSYAGSGAFSLFQPGRGGEFKSNVNIVDEKWHYLAAILEPERVRLYVDGELALDKPATALTGSPQPGGLAFGRLVEGGIGCDGLVDEVRLSRGPRDITGMPKDPFPKDAQTIGHWSFDD